MKLDITKEAIGTDSDGNPVYLKDVWPTRHEVAEALKAALSKDMFEKRYANVFEGPAEWQAVETSGGMTYKWEEGSTYVQNPPFFTGMTMQPDPVADIKGARALALFVDSITTDHISPAGAIKKDSPAGSYLTGYQVRPADFNSYGSRRGNHEVMMRGTFANIRIRNEMLPGTEGGYTPTSRRARTCRSTTRR